MKLPGILGLFLISFLFVMMTYSVRLDFAETNTFHTLRQDFFPPETSLETLDGKEILSTETLPKEPSLIFFFGTWCRPCVIEHPMIVELSKQYRIPFIGIAMKDDDQKLSAFLEKQENPYRMVGLDKEMAWGKHFNAATLPVVYLMNSEGRIVYKFRGVLTKTFFEEHILPKIKGEENAAPLS